MPRLLFEPHQRLWLLRRTILTGIAGLTLGATKG